MADNVSWNYIIILQKYDMISYNNIILDRFSDIFTSVNEEGYHATKEKIKIEWTSHFMDATNWGLIYWVINGTRG